MQFHKITSRNLVVQLVGISLLLMFVAGCIPKVRLVGQYDEIIDKSVHELESKTIAHINKIIDNHGEGEGSYEQCKQFYFDIKGEVQTLVVRAESLENGLKKTPLTDNFKELGRQYEDLELLHKTPYNKDAMAMAQRAFDQSFRAIVKHLIYMKWNQEQPKES